MIDIRAGVHADTLWINDTDSHVLDENIERRFTVYGDNDFNLVQMDYQDVGRSFSASPDKYIVDGQKYDTVNALVKALEDFNVGKLIKGGGGGGGGGEGVWGSITGDLEDQEDLVEALEDKMDIPTGTPDQVLGGDGVPKNTLTLSAGTGISIDEDENGITINAVSDSLISKTVITEETYNIVIDLNVDKDEEIDVSVFDKDCPSLHGMSLNIGDQNNVEPEPFTSYVRQEIGLIAELQFAPNATVGFLPSPSAQIYYGDAQNINGCFVTINIKNYIDVPKLITSLVTLGGKSTDAYAMSYRTGVDITYMTDVNGRLPSVEISNPMGFKPGTLIVIRRR